MKERPHKVYVLTDRKGKILNINSGDHLTDNSMWTQIDEGHGDRYHHAQRHYLPAPLRDERGIYRYKLVNGRVMERTEEEMNDDWKPVQAVPTDNERITELEEALDMILTGVTE